MAWTRKLLRVNLTAGTISEEALNMQWANDYLGQRGLATRYLVEEMDPKADPLGPDNKFIMATGPLTGTNASTGGRYSCVCKSPLTNALACSNSGGFFGAELMTCGVNLCGKPTRCFAPNTKTRKSKLQPLAEALRKVICTQRLSTICTAPLVVVAWERLWHRRI